MDNNINNLSDFPMVKPLIINDNLCAIYDAKANLLFSTSDIEFEAISGYLCNHEDTNWLTKWNHVEDVDGLLKQIKLIIKKGALKPGPTNYVFNTEEEPLKTLIKYYQKNIFMRKFVIEITEQCNFACRYCPNTHEERTRHHTSNHMSIETAKASTDFYYRLYINFFSRIPETHRKKFIKHFPPTLGFYGGETTLNWQVMEDTILYFESLDWEKYGIPKTCVTSSINTNLYWLKETWIDFLTQHNTMIFVSLDGPQEENDRNRIDISGKGTFSHVYKNLMRIKARNEKYFKENVIILSVDAINNDYEISHKFLDNLGCQVIYSDEQPYDCLNYNAKQRCKEMKANESQWIKDTFNWINTQYNINPRATCNEFRELSRFNSIETDITDYEPMNVLITCPLVFDNLMIGVDGSIHFCHKTDGSLPLGDVFQGYDSEKLYNAYKAFGDATNSKECCNCWAVRFCHYCSANWLRDGKFVHPSYDDCEFQRTQLERSLKLYILLNNQKPEVIEEILKLRHNLEHHQGILDFNEFIKSDPD